MRDRKRGKGKTPEFKLAWKSVVEKLMRKSDDKFAISTQRINFSFVSRAFQRDAKKREKEES